MRAHDPIESVITSAQVLDALPIVAFMARPDGRVAYVSHGWSDLTGLNARGSFARAYREVVEPTHLESVVRAWRDALRTESSYRMEFPLRHADGSYRYVLAQATPMRDGGAIVGWFGTLTDIDALKRGEVALRESDRRQRAFADALPGITWSATPDGKLDFVGERWSVSRGRERSSALGDAWLESVHPDEREAVFAMWRLAVATGTPYDAEFRTRMVDGAYRWQLVRALPVRDESGTIVRWVGVNIDVDDRRRAESAREMFVALAENSDDCITIGDRSGKIEYVNAAGRRLLGLGPSPFSREMRFGELFASGDRARLDAEILPAVARSGRWRGEVSLRGEGDVPIPVEFDAFEIFDARGGPLGIAAVSRDRRERARVESGLRLLSRTGAAVLDMLDYSATLSNIARVCVENFASYCIIDVRDAAGTWERTAAHHSQELQSVIEELSPPSAQHPIMRALEAGESSLNSVDETWVRSVGGSGDRERAVRALDVRSFVTVAVRTPAGEIIGALTCGLDGTASRNHYRFEDLGFVEEVGRRIGAAIANARIFARERRIAVEFQAASLPATLPQADDLRLVADYRPGSDEATIGGDWYDAFVLDDGRIAITVGDVLGHGLHAAVTMTKLRQAMQSAAMMHPDPNAMLRVADKTLRLIDPDGYATAIAAIYDRTTQTLTYASAGHPGPAKRDPIGNVTDCTRSGPMLGLRGDDERAPIVIGAPAGSTFVFYTDGLIEATRDVEAGSLRLHEALARDDVPNEPDAARAIVDFVLAGGDASDDIAVLVARIGPVAAA